MRTHSRHERDGAFIIPNPWDVGTARLLAHLRYEALATTSASYAFSVGQRDNTIDCDRMMKHVAEIVSATDSPISVGLEHSFGDRPETVTETIRLAAVTVLAGGSIEDVTNRTDNLIAESLPEDFEGRIRDFRVIDPDRNKLDIATRLDS